MVKELQNITIRCEDSFCSLAAHRKHTALIIVIVVFKLKIYCGSDTNLIREFEFAFLTFDILDELFVGQL